MGASLKSLDYLTRFTPRKDRFLQSSDKRYASIAGPEGGGTYSSF